jgi:hypothetical protein
MTSEKNKVLEVSVSHRKELVVVGQPEASEMLLQSESKSTAFT